jgi:hypothetical protein
MYMKKQGLTGNSRDLPKSYVAVDKRLIAPGRMRGREKGELKNEGISQNVVENKHRKNVGVRVCQNVYENKQLKLNMPECL